MMYDFFGARRKGSTVTLTSRGYQATVPVLIDPEPSDRAKPGFTRGVVHPSVRVAIPAVDGTHSYPAVLVFETASAADEIARIATEAGRLLRLRYDEPDGAPPHGFCVEHGNDRNENGTCEYCEAER